MERPCLPREAQPKTEAVPKSAPAEGGEEEPVPW